MIFHLTVFFLYHALQHFPFNFITQSNDIESVVLTWIILGLIWSVWKHWLVSLYSRITFDYCRMIHFDFFCRFLINFVFELNTSSKSGIWIIFLKKYPGFYLCQVCLKRKFLKFNPLKIRNLNQKVSL